MLSCMFESLYLEFRTGQIVEVVPKPGFRWVIEGAGITMSRRASCPATHR